jgi:hypothetical protein
MPAAEPQHSDTCWAHVPVTAMPAKGERVTAVQCTLTAGMPADQHHVSTNMSSRALQHWCFAATMDELAGSYRCTCNVC